MLTSVVIMVNVGITSPEITTWVATKDTRNTRRTKSNE